VALPVGAHVSLLAGLLRLLTKDQPLVVQVRSFTY
ncbi:hypothetical protein QUC31_013970, partial [Theobroma cacao]